MKNINAFIDQKKDANEALISKLIEEGYACFSIT